MNWHLASEFPPDFVSYLEQLAEARMESLAELTTSITRVVDIFFARATSAKANTSSLGFEQVRSKLIHLPLADAQPQPGRTPYVALGTTLGMEFHALTCDAFDPTLLVRGAIVLPGEARRPDRVRAFAVFPLQAACSFITAERFEEVLDHPHDSSKFVHPFPVYTAELRGLREHEN
ncbi:MAG: hypothetical protein KC776_33815 [Myxococcales bacterium]|nr:hypothetical protein [Myxococcales bacterium]MCB9577595.1 hypothetical protein [Polyangiaceae bacterium]